MDTNQHTTQLLSSFLHRLAEDITSGTLDSSSLQMVGEFYMSYLFAEQVKKDNKPIRKGRRRTRARKTRCTFRVRSPGFGDLRDSPSRADLRGDDQEDDPFNTHDLQKFVCLGWYIYSKILNGETV